MWWPSWTLNSLMRKRQIGVRTTYPDAFRKYVMGHITIEEYRNSDMRAKYEPIYAEDGPEITPEELLRRRLTLAGCFGLAVGLATGLLVGAIIWCN